MPNRVSRHYTAKMYAILISCVLAAVSAAPHYHHRHHGSMEPYMSSSLYSSFGAELFDTRSFWEELANEMRQLDVMLKEFSERFPSSVSKEGIEGDQYKIVIPLVGYTEQEIAVKAREGVLMVQAIHKSEEGNQRSYLDVRTLPSIIELSGTWTYDKEVLTIQFPVKKDASTETTVTIQPVTHETEEHSREEMGQDNDDVQDVDFDARGDQKKETEVLTNEIPDKNEVEATTYAVDLKDEVEFVPVRY